jgi:alginate O-acetyltransferase complex protein AlgI
MVYSNPEFFVFFLATLSLYVACRGSYRARFTILVVSSLIFYAWSGFFDTGIFFCVVIVSWWAVWAATRWPTYRRGFIIFGVATMAAHLLFWKYAPWVASGFNRSLTLPLPIGISFFTLQGIAYLIDFYDREAAPVGFRKYLLFKSFFPQLVAGPIVRAHELMPQLDVLRPPLLSDVDAGLSLFVLGFFKKIALADPMSRLVDPVFLTPESFSRATLVQAVLAYSVQIWGDFSGYTDMGRGAARMLGIHLPENFLSPYFARSPSDFWRRWHITLSRWIRDYIYIPLGGSRGSVARGVFVAVVTFVLSGLWHGAAITFVLWGLYHGSLLALERATDGSKWVTNAVNRVSGSRWRYTYDAGVRVVMFVAVAFGWLLFRAQGWANVKAYLGALVKPGASVVNDPEILLFALICCFGIQAAGLVKREWQPSSTVLGGLQWGTVLATVVVLTLWLRAGHRSTTFIYFQF